MSASLPVLLDDEVLALAAEYAAVGECLGPGLVFPEDLPCGRDCDCCATAARELNRTEPET